MVLGFLYFYMALFAYTNSVAINVVTPYIFFIVTGIISYAYRFSVEDYKKEKLKRAMKKYVNTTVVDDIMKNSEEEVKLGGKKTELTILIADMRGFTKISENLDPNEVTNLLNEYFGQMIPIIEQHNGAVNKFIGDAILAVFNEPIRALGNVISLPATADCKQTRISEISNGCTIPVELSIRSTKLSITSTTKSNKSINS